MRDDCESCGGSQHATVYRRGATVDIACCTTCGLVWNRQMLGGEAVDYYSSDYREEFQPEFRDDEPFSPSFLASMLTRAACVTEFLGDDLQPGRRHLDLGCGEGTLLAFTREKGLLVTGMELDQRLSRFAHDRYGLTVHQGTLDTVDLPKRAFDLVSLVHVVEHLFHPVDVLRQAAELLADEGRLLIEVPNLFQPWQRPGRFFFREHSYYFSANSLRRIAAAAGLSPVRLGTSRRDGSLQLLLRKSPQARIDAAWNDTPGQVRRSILTNRLSYYLGLRNLRNKLHRQRMKQWALCHHGHLLAGDPLQRQAAVRNRAA